MRAALSAQVARLRAGAKRGLEAELTLTVPNDVAVIEEAVNLVTRHLEVHFVDRHSIRFNLRVALTEALANAMLYGAASPSEGIGVRVLFGRHSVEMEVTDRGKGFDPTCIPDPTLPENRERPDGRGLFLIQHLMDEVRFNATGNSICMILRRA